MGMFLLAGAAAAFLAFRGRTATDNQESNLKLESKHHADDQDGIVLFATTRWTHAKVQIQPVIYGPFTEKVWRGGRLMLNESRTAHLTPMLEGVVREVKVRLGDEVKVGDVLAVLNCKDIGQAKLDLVKARMAADYAKAQHEWTQALHRNVSDLLKAFASGTPLTDLEKQFKDRPIGEFRQPLVTAYGQRQQTRAQHNSMVEAEASGAVTMMSLQKVRADYESAETSFLSLCEEVKFQTMQQSKLCEQKLREADTALALSKSVLLMAGYSSKELETMDPLAEGGAVAMHPIRAPFSGTIIEQNVVIGERAVPQEQMFQIADLSELWLQADVPQSDLSLVRKLKGAVVRFRVNEGDPPSSATVFYTGDVVDKSSRSILLTALVPNPERTHKPGTFVEVEFAHIGPKVVQAPQSAVQRIGAQPFVFVYLGGERFRRVDLKLGRTSEGLVEILSGLDGTETIAASGGFILKSEMLKDQLTGD